MPERKPRDHATATPTAADPAEHANQQAHHAGGMTAVAPKGATASQQAYGSDMQSMKLQMNMDRKEKEEETLSNIEKKDSKTEEDITKNMK